MIDIGIAAHVDHHSVDLASPELEGCHSRVTRVRTSCGRRSRETPSTNGGRGSSARTGVTQRGRVPTLMDWVDIRSFTLAMTTPTPTHFGPGSSCRRRLSGNTQHAVDWMVLSSSGGMSMPRTRRSRRPTHGKGDFHTRTLRSMGGRGPARSVHMNPTPTASMTWRAMFGNGPTIGIWTGLRYHNRCRVALRRGGESQPEKRATTQRSPRPGSLGKSSRAGRISALSNTVSATGPQPASHRRSTPVPATSVFAASRESVTRSEARHTTADVQARLAFSS